MDFSIISRDSKLVTVRMKYDYGNAEEEVHEGIWAVVWEHNSLLIFEAGVSGQIKRDNLRLLPIISVTIDVSRDWVAVMMVTFDPKAPVAYIDNFNPDDYKRIKFKAEDFVKYFKIPML